MGNEIKSVMIEAELCRLDPHRRAQYMTVLKGCLEFCDKCRKGTETECHGCKIRALMESVRAKIGGAAK